MRLMKWTGAVLLWVGGAAVCVLLTIAASLVQRGYGFVLPPHGTALGEYEGIVVYAPGGYDTRGEYGLEYQCVELVNRALTRKRGHRNLTRTGDADTYFWYGEDKGLVVYNNGSPVPPEPWDVLVFDGGDDDGSVGHVAIVTQVHLASGRVEFIQQNATACVGHVLCKYVWKDSLPIVREADGWRVVTKFNPPVAGWSRSKETK